jgi:hypothetical protein
MIEEASLGKSEKRDAETRAWFEAVKVFLSAYALGFLTCVWLMWHMGVLHR